MADNSWRSTLEFHTEGLGEFKKVEQAATSTGKAFDKLAQSERQAAEAGKAMGSSNSDMARNLAALAGIGLSAYGLKVLATDIARGTYELGRLGAQAITVRDSFAYMTQSVGMNAGMLKQLQAAAGGTINSMKLMELSNMALVGLGPQVGNALASQEARLIEISRAALKANPAIGSVEFAYNSLVLGVKRLEKRLVDNIGLQVKVNDANTEYAASIGKTVDQLSAEDKQMAMLNAILKGGSRLIEQIGGDVNTMNDSFLRATTSAQEFKIALGEALAPSMAKGAGTVSLFLDSMTAMVSGDPISKQQSEIKNNEAALANYIGWVGKTAEAERQRVAMVQYLNAALAEQRAHLILLNTALNSGAQTKAEKEARRLVGTTYDASDALTQQELEARRLVGTVLNVAQAEAIAIARSLALAAAARRGGDGLIAMSQAARIARGSLKGLTDDYKSFLESGKEGIVSSFVSAGMSDSDILSSIASFQQGAAKIELEYGPGNSTNKKIALERLRQQYQDSVSDYKDSLKDMTSATNDAFEEMQGIIASKLEPSFSVDDLAPDLVVREDAVDEHYRRLAAIALRGQEEIDKHNVDWADTIAEIPADIRAKGIEAMQAWAKEKVIAYGKGLDTSLVNRERIKQLVMEQIQANKMRDELVSEIYAEMGGSVSLKDVQAAAGDVTGTGSAMGAAISTGVKDSIDVDGMLKTTASAINAGAKTYAQQLKTSGGSVGGIILDGITTAVTDGAPDIVKKLAESLAPSVAKILENNARRSGQ